MHYLLQSNLSTEAQLVPFVEALDSLKPLGATWSFIKLIPFVGDVEPDIDYASRKVFALGSTSLIIAAQKRGWSPGVIYDAALFRYEAWLRNLGRENLLNGDGRVCRFADAAWVMDDMALNKAFIRPCEDLKAFTGEVMKRENLANWIARVKDGEISTRALQLTSNTPVVIARSKFVYREWRFFVVDGKVISGSQYRDAYGKREDADVPPDAWAFAQTMVNQWPMAPCFVIDIGEIKQGLRVVEINCFNGSGAYLCDLKRVFTAVERFYEQPT